MTRRVVALLALVSGAAHCQRAGPPPAAEARPDAAHAGARRAPENRVPLEKTPAEEVPAEETPLGAEPEAAWSVGATSRARAVAVRSARHDGDAGASRIELEPLAGSAAPRVSHEAAGIWQPLGYVEAAGAHLFGGAFQRGAWLPVVVLGFLDERTGAWRLSRAGGGDFVAMAAVSSPRGRFFAFVRSAADSFEVVVLDPIAEAFARAGAAPAPPPLGPDAECPSDIPHAWGSSVDGFVALDPGVIEFADERTLVIRYGEDGCRRRATARRERRVDVLELFARRVRATPDG